jgi:quercetin dioxygenase-like cupin family protein
MSQPTLLPALDPAALRLADALQASASGIVSRTVLQTPELRVVLFTFADGQELTTHTNTRRAFIQVLEGTGEFLFGGRWEKLGAGTVLHLPPRAPHAVRAGSGPFAMLLTLSAEPAPTAPVG